MLVDMFHNNQLIVLDYFKIFERQSVQTFRIRSWTIRMRNKSKLPSLNKVTFVPQSLLRFFLSSWLEFLLWSPDSGNPGFFGGRF